ncbi:alpha,alpha-trehalose-phosphate synthase (UDP-forming) [Natronococcus occultus]|uniref:Trehalose-6-phosphate synthase n=1 Tax=Natronococcus occultus SP4 TaxID=694430 RepID=L0K1U9_9EURY|nr:trehalose-6-phosphate synthase [Natronococcus occultus]AGB38976.1 Trehalose-6-phosphate synthase [Natronococcus occultus SP4]
MRNTEHRLPDGSADGRRADGGSRPDETDADDPDCPESLIVVSNRQPYRHEYEDGDGDERSIAVDEPAGGLTAGLDPVVREASGTWIAWGDGEADFAVTDENDCVAVPPGEDAYTLQRIDLSEEAVDSYYYGFSNQVLWPLCHEFPDLIENGDTWSNDFEWYHTVNERFADAVATHATAESVVWIQDYHFGLAPRLIRRQIPETATIAHFWHIPWPTPETFAECPAGEDVLAGLLGNDLLGFHVDRYARLFMECVEQYLDGAVVDRDRWIVDYEDGTTHLTTDAMGVDADTYDRAARQDTDVDAVLAELGVSPDVTLGLGVDRLDYSKGIPERLAALERFFERNPDRRGEFTFLQKATPSRTGIPAYQRLGELVRSEVTRINSRFGTDDWQPIVYTEEYVSQENLCALYRRADAMLISPLLDGMNLVAQEFVASSVDEDGVLLLSEQTGAHERLGDDAVTIDPTDTDGVAAALETALEMPADERRRRMRTLREDVFEADLEAWMDSQFAAIARLHGSRESTDEQGAQTPPV